MTSSISSCIQSIKLGRGGPRFQLSVHAENARTLLKEADLIAFREVLPNVQPSELRIISSKDDWSQLDDQCWQEACESFGACTKLDYHVAEMQEVISHVPELTDITIHDSLHAYGETFFAIASHLRRLESLILKNAASGAFLDEKCCGALAHLVRSTNLNKFELSDVIFESHQCWNLVFEALLSCEDLQEVTFYNLSTFTEFGTTKDINSFAHHHPHHSSFVEKLVLSSCHKSSECLNTSRFGF